MNAKIILGIALLIVLVFCVYPFVALIETLFSSGANTVTEHLSYLFRSKSTYKAFINTLTVSLLTACLSSLIALPLSWLLSRTKLKGQKVWRSLFCLAYAIPPYIAAIAWIILANPSNGLLNTVLGEGTLNIYTYTGLVWVMSTFFYTLVLLSLLTAFDRVDPALEEAARLSGASPLKVFFTVTLPICKTSLTNGFILVFLAASASFGVPAIVGSPAQIYMLTTQIYTYQKMGSLNGTQLAGTLSIILLGLVFAALLIQKMLSKEKHLSVVGGKSSRTTQLDWGKKEIYIQTGLAFLFTVLFLLPLMGIFMSALSAVQGQFSFSTMTLDNFVSVFFETDETPRALWNSLSLAFFAATACTIAGLFIAYIQTKTKVRGRKLLDVLISLPYTTPGTVLALALILASSIHFFGIKISLYNTLALIVIAYFSKFLNFSVRTTADAFAQIDDSLAEAARISGATWSRTIKKIWIPLLLPAITASWFLVFMPSFSELTMTLLLGGPGLETTGTLLFQLQEYGDSSGGGAAVIAIVIIFFVLAINYSLKFLSKGKYGL